MTYILQDHHRNIGEEGFEKQREKGREKREKICSSGCGKLVQHLQPQWEGVGGDWRWVGTAGEGSFVEVEFGWFLQKAKKKKMIAR